MLAANMKLLCFKNVKVSINLFLQEMYKAPYMLQIVLNSKHMKENTKTIEKLAALYLAEIKQKIDG